MPAIELCEHSPLWSGAAADEGARISGALGACIIAVHHIGSTSIPGIRAKPVIDLMPAATSLAALDAREAEMRALGYEWLGEFGIAGRRFCRRDDPKSGRRLFNVHAFASGDPGVARHLAFRDYLRAHPELARAYEAEKLRAGALHPEDIGAYTDEKSAWIKRVEKEALAWSASALS